MPRAKLRGRRDQRRKRKVEYDVEGEEGQCKRTRLDDKGDCGLINQEGAESLGSGHHAHASPADHSVYYGMLDEEEQEYFKRADELLELNQFENQDARSLFLTNVYREADGKELKLACSQSCSRLMERLIQLSDTKQLKSLFQKISGQ